MSKRRIIELSTGRIYNSSVDAGRATGANPSTVRIHVGGRIKNPRFAYYSPNPEEQEKLLEEQRERINKRFGNKQKRPEYPIMFVDDKIKHKNIAVAERYYNYGVNTIRGAIRRGRKTVMGRQFVLFDPQGNAVEYEAKPLLTHDQKSKIVSAAHERQKQYNDKRVDNLLCVACLTDLKVLATREQAVAYYDISGRTNISASINQACAIVAWKQTKPTRCHYIRPTASILAYLDIVYMWGDVESQTEGMPLQQKSQCIKEFYKKAKEILYSTKGLEEDGEVIDLETGERFANIQAVADNYNISYKAIWLALINGMPCVDAKDNLYYFALTNPKYEDYKDSILTQKKFFEKNKN